MILNPLQAKPTIPADLWNNLYSWLPGIGSCTQNVCEISNFGTAFYILLVTILVVTTRETYLRFYKSNGGDVDGNSSEKGDDDINAAEDEMAETANTDHSFMSRLIGFRSETESEGKSESSAEEVTNSEGEEGSFGDSDGNTRSILARLYSLCSIGSKIEDEEEDNEEEPIVGDGQLRITPEFSDILDDEVAETLVDEDSTVSQDFSLDESHLPPHLDEGDHDPDAFLSRVERLHQRQIAPDEVEKDPAHYQVGDQHRRVLYAHKQPDVTQLAGLKSVVDDPTLHFDLTVHFHAQDKQSTLRSAKNLYNNLEASVGVESEGGSALTAGDKQRRKEKVREYRDHIKQHDERPVATSMYVSVHDEDEERLLEKVDELRDEFRTNSDIRLKTLERKQKKALVSASPIGLDTIHSDDPDLNPTHQMLGRSFGAIMAGMTQSRKFEPSGHEWGTHSVQGHPIVKDPFQSQRNYNMVVVGESGSGKSLNTKRMALATKAVREDTLIIMLDPLQGFMGMAEALDAEKVTIGGQQHLNPMEIRKPPKEHIESEAWDEDKDPLSAKVDDVMAFLQNFVAQQPGLEFGDESQLLRSLILEAYKEKGITHDVRTHDIESPTLKDVLRLADHAHENPAEWAKGPQEPETIREQASALGTILREFSEGGQYDNLAQPSEEDVFGDNDVIYLDLSQEEASGGGGTGVMGQLMFSLAYEKCKQYPGPAIYIVDEARYLFREADTLEYLAQRVRHSRHYDTSIRFITQEMDDFFEFDQAEGIVNNSSFQVIHQSADVDGWGDRFGLKEPHKQFVKTAATGTDKPYSQALVRFPEKDQWFPLTIRLGERMLAIADFDEQEDSYADLPGQGETAIEQSPIAREMVARIRNGTISHQDALEELLEEWERPLWEMLTEERAMEAINQISNGRHPRDVLYSQALDQVQWVIDSAGGDDISERLVERLKSTIQQQYAQSYGASAGDESTDSDLEVSQTHTPDEGDWAEEYAETDD